MRIKNHPRLKTVLIIFLAVLISSCADNSTGAVIDDAGLFLDPSGTQATTTYSWRDVFYCVVTVSEATPETVIKASWVAVETNRAEPNLVLKIEEKHAGAPQLIFKLENIGHFWPVGTYQLFIYLDGNLDRILDFNVVDTKIS